MSPQRTEQSISADDPLERTTTTKEKGSVATEGMVCGDALDEAIGDEADGIDPDKTSAEDDPLEKAEATKEKR